VGVKLLIEPEPGLLIETVAQYDDLRSRIAHPFMGLNYDVGHMYCVREPLGDTIRRLGQQIDHVHIEDIAASRIHRHLVPGDGAIDFTEVFAALAEIRYDNWVTVELYPFIDDPDTAGRRARDHLRSFMKMSKQP
jgi:sugar phosphate isomerase/epimerase